MVILAIAVDNSLDPGRVSEIDIEQNGKELTDAGAVVAKCRYRAHMLRTRTVCQEFSELIRRRAVHKRVIRNTRKHEDPPNSQFQVLECGKLIAAHRSESL